MRLRPSLGHSWSAYRTVSTWPLALLVVILLLITNEFGRYVYFSPYPCLLCPVEEVLGRRAAQSRYGVRHRVLWVHSHHRKREVAEASYHELTRYHIPAL